MTRRRPPSDTCQACRWCDEGARAHSRHIAYSGTWFGVSPDYDRKGVIAQVWSFADVLPHVRPAITLLPSPGIQPISCELTWDDAARFTAALAAAKAKFTS